MCTTNSMFLTHSGHHTTIPLRASSWTPYVQLLQRVFLLCGRPFSSLRSVCARLSTITVGTAFLPFDPFQMMSGNNAKYHDIHHQVYFFTIFLSKSVLIRHTDYWHQVQLLTAFLYPLGHPPWYAHD
ncbi:hypothetical protein K503DRAFT_368090 [Rhizopogon vinicolor AM-OR11-026]|uniref:Fatty acid hydroxylase domain-containing protein n=1 Tax=Rhizopogon vinicolor AM-OR11-026 TaxID=1314800 RepID=A0A1B7MS59_9AGAM|nr:hypothetical protein K503DRAFT_368090 [Rhizopogon vinicolor AM-OR11-026]